MYCNAYSCNAIVITDGGGGERSDSATGGRRSGKRPEVQHYKPGAFSGSRKPEDCEGNPGNSNNSTATEKTSSTGGKGGQPSEDKPQQVWPLTKFCWFFVKIIIDLPGGQINDPSRSGAKLHAVLPDSKKF